VIFFLVGAIGYLPGAFILYELYFGYDIHLPKREHVYLLVPIAGLIFGALSVNYWRPIVGPVRGAWVAVATFAITNFLVLLAAVVVDVVFFSGASFAPRPHDSALLVFAFFYVFSLIVLGPCAGFVAVLGALAGWTELRHEPHKL
jgi:hypothetical protein